MVHLSTEPTSNPLSRRGFFVLPLILVVAVFLGIGGVGYWLINQSKNEVEAIEVGSSSGKVLGVATGPQELAFNIPAIFKQLVTAAALTVEGEAIFGGSVVFEDAATFAQDVIIDGQLTLKQNITGDNIDIDLQDGTVIASNLVYSVTEGSGITVSGDQDLVIENTDKGSSQKIFSKIKVGSETIEADSNTDQLTLTGGSGVSLSRSGDEITFSAANISGWYQPTSSFVALVTGTNYVGIGTTVPTNKLEVDSGTDGLSGLTFSRLTSGSSAGIGGGKVLSLDSGGKVILVQDQTGESTPSAEAILPSAVTGGTLYFNGLNWVSSTNLFHDGGSVGISTTSPAGRFQVNTNAAATRGIVVQGAAAQSANLQEWRDSDGNVLAYITSAGVFNGSANTSGTLNPGFTTGSVVFQGASGLTQDNSNFFWDDSSNELGLGTTSPAALLDVNGTSYLEQIAFREDTTYTSTTHNAQLYQSGGNLFIDAEKSFGRSIYLRTGTGTSSTRMAIVENGTVGIGTTIPTARLHINGGYGANDTFTVNQTNSSGNILSASASGATKFVITNAGNVGIGTTNPTTLFQLGDSTSGHTRMGAFEFDLRYSTESRVYLTNNIHALMGTGNGGGGIRLIGLNGSSYSYIGGGSTNQLLLNPVVGNVAIGTTSPTARLHVEGGFGANDAFTINQTLGGNIFSASASGATKMVLTNAGSLGIGTTVPDQMVHIFNNSAAPQLHVQGALNSDTFTPALLLTEEDGSDSGFFMRYFGSSNRLGIGRNGSSEWLSITRDTGFVGIGSTAPNNKLEVVGGTSAAETDLLQIRSNFSVGNTASTLKFVNSASTTADTGSGEISVLRLGSLAGGNMIFRTYNEETNLMNENMRITSLGVIGIGTSNPTAKLHVVGGYGSNDAFTINQTLGGNIMTASSAGVTKFIIDNGGKVGIGTTAAPNYSLDVYGNHQITSNNTLAFYVQNTNTSPIFAVMGGAKTVGIGTSSPTAPLFVNGAYGSNDAFTVDQRNGGNILSASASGATKMVLTNAGYIGLGTTSPSQNLHVVGNILASGSVQVSDGSSFISNDTSLLRAHGTNGIKFTTWNSGVLEAMRIVATTGNIGIGTTAPLARLDVWGGSGILPVASISGQTSFAALLADNNGVGDLFTASKSGATKVVISNAGNVGIGTSTPLAALDIGTAGGKLIFEGQTGVNLYRNATHLKTDAIFDANAFSAANSLSAGGPNSVMGGGAAASGNPALTINTGTDDRMNLVLKKRATQTADLTQWQDQNGNALTVIDAAGAMGIGTTDPGTNMLKVQGDFEVTGACTGCSSDSRLKTDIQQLPASSLEKLLSIKGVTFNWSDNQKKRDYPQLQMGVIAQDVEAVFPELVGLDSRGYKYVRYDKLIAPTIEAIREQQSQLTLLNTKVTAINQQGEMVEVSQTTVEQLPPLPPPDSEATSLLAQLGNLTNNTWRFIANVVFGGTARFDGIATFMNQTIFKGSAQFDQAIMLSQDAAGVVIIPKDQTEATFTFSKKYPHAPLVNITPYGAGSTGYFVKSVTDTGFVVALSEPAQQDRSFTWSAVLTPTPAPSPLVPGVPAPTAQLETTPSPTPTIAPESSPLPSPSPVTESNTASDSAEVI